MKKLLLPLEFTKLQETHFKHVWDTVDELRKAALQIIPWDEFCYIPAPILVGLSSDLRKYPVSLAYAISACASWRRSKEIYKFDPDTEKLLMEQADDLDVPSESLLRLPFPCIYVESSLEQEEINGFFAQVVNVTEMNRYLLNLLILFENMSYFSFDVELLPGKSIFDGLESYKKTQAEYELYRDLTSKSIQLLLYICAQNAVIVENPKQRKRTHRNNKGLIYDTEKEVRKWDVGLRYRKVKNRIPAANTLPTTDQELPDSAQEEDVSPSSRKRPRPHVRQSHWHRYWTGSRKDGTRKVVLHWIGVSVINGDIDEIPVVLNELT